jgi:HAD superfamily hydrolase (TIGR01509 family)
MNSLKAVIFDMDGVLIDSEIHFGKELPAVFEHLGIPWTKQDALATIGMNFRAIYAYLVKRYHIHMSWEEFFPRFENEGRGIYTKVALVSGASDLLMACRTSGLRIALASSSPRSWIEVVLSRFSLDGLFDAVVSGTEFRERGKPAPDIFLHTARLLGVEPSDCVVIEDSVAGVQAAKAAGMRCVGFANLRYNHAQDLREADYIISELTELTPARLVASHR